MRSLAITAALWLGLASAGHAQQAGLSTQQYQEPLRPQEVLFYLDQVAVGAEATGVRPKTTTRFDAVWPVGPEEHRRLGGYGLLLITTVSHDPNTFPTKSVVIRTSGGEFRLRSLAALTSRTAFGSRVARVLGPHREEALYLAPVALMSSPGGQVVQQFADGTEGTPWNLPATPPTYRWLDGTLSAPDPDAMERLLTRSIVGFPFGPWVLIPLRTTP